MTLADLWLRMRALLFRTRVERELQEELDFHLDMQVRKHVREGLSADDARRKALQRFGRRSLVAEECRELRRGSLLDQLWQDVRYTVRISATRQGFTFIAILTLALGIGANTAIFSVVHAVLLRPLPYANSGRVVRVSEDVPPRAGSAGGPRRTAPVAVADVAALRSATTTLSHVGVHLPAIRTLTGAGDPVRLVGAKVSPDIFPMLDAHPLMGRTFDAHEDSSTADPVVVLSYGTWRRQFGGDPRAIGQRVELDGTTHVVIGVMDPAFAFPDPRDEFWIPFVVQPSDARRLPITARLRDGVTPPAAAAELRAIVPGLRGDPQNTATAEPPRIALVPLLELVVAPVRPALRMLTAAVGFVLLIACANVANLLLARTNDRRREIAVRRALGAGRGRLVRQALTESVLLAVVGGIAGIGLAFGGIRLLRTLAASLPRRDLGAVTSLPRLEEIGVDGSVLAFSVIVSILTGLLFGLAPALRQLGTESMNALREGAGSALSGFNLFRRHRMQGFLVVAEITLAVILFVGGALLIHSFVKLSSVSLGYDPRDVLTFQVSLPGDPDPRLRALADHLVERIQSLPHVRAAGYVESLPMTRVSRRFVPLRKTREMLGPPRLPSPGRLPPEMPDTQFVSKDFLAAMGIPVIEGRALGENDRAGQPQVMLINRSLARSGLFGSNPVGQRIYGFGDESWEVVGIVDDIRQSAPAQSAEPQIFIDFRQVPQSEAISGVGLYFAVRTDRAPESVASSVRGLAKQLEAQAIVENIAPMEQLVSNSLTQARLYAVLLGIFAGVAVVLAGIGIYGVMAASVAQRTREIGIHVALGARRSQVMALVIGQSVVLVAVGLTLGLVGAAAVTRYLEGMLFGLTPLDPATFVVVSVLFAGVAMVAAYVPVRRATTVDPLVALRYE
jgi:predicted permease